MQRCMARLGMLARAATSDVDGACVHGRGKIGTAKALAARGLVRFREGIGVYEPKIYITDAGRRALKLWEYKSVLHRKRSYWLDM